MERSFAIAQGPPIINQICQPEFTSDVGRRCQSSQKAFFGGYQFKRIYTFNSGPEGEMAMDAIEEEGRKMRRSLGLGAGLSDGTWTISGPPSIKAWHLLLKRSPKRIEITLEWRGI